MKRDLRELPVPEHRDGFWHDLATRLADEGQELPLDDRARPFPGWILAPAAAVVALVAMIGVSGLLGGEEAEIGAPEDPPPSLTTPTSTVTTLAGELPDAPWAPAVAVDGVPQVLVDEWQEAENRTWCSALTIGDPALTAGHTPRAANFSGGWAVAYDSADLRSAFGVGGTGSVRDVELALRWPTVHQYADGSVVGYGGEGFVADNPRRLADLVVAGQGCLYQVWSELGDEHLGSVIESLRFVDGLQAEPVELVTEVEVRDGGEAPWVANPPTDVLPFEPAGRAAAGITGPLLVPTTVDLDNATIRTANIAAWGVAWDAPGLPGHDSLNMPCAECGRGVVGYAESFPADGLTAPVGRQLRIEYADGSYVEVGYYVGLDQLPPERPQFTTVDTGQPTIGGYQASVFVADGRQYLMWSHLGIDHLLGLVEGLREVASPGG